jgi:peptide/nickel transport system permease protein
VTVALCWLGLVSAVAVAAPWLAPHDPAAQDLLNAYAPPSPEHWLGTDATGRDIASRLIAGTRLSLLAPACVLVLGLCVGVPLALLAAWRGGVVDAVVARLLEVVFAIPAILLAVLAVAVFGTGAAPAVVALSIAYLPYIARVVRVSALEQISRPYIAALRIQGSGSWTIVARHVLPNIAPIIIAQAPVTFASALVDLSALSFLGLAVQPPEADWGALVNDSTALLAGHPMQIVYASLLIVATVVSLMTVSDAMAERRGGRPSGGQRPRTPRRNRATV